MVTRNTHVEMLCAPRHKTQRLQDQVAQGTQTDALASSNKARGPVRGSRAAASAAQPRVSRTERKSVRLCTVGAAGEGATAMQSADAPAGAALARASGTARMSVGGQAAAASSQAVMAGKAAVLNGTESNHSSDAPADAEGSVTGELEGYGSDASAAVEAAAHAFSEEEEGAGDEDGTKSEVIHFRLICSIHELRRQT